jgi:hypothetical protein
MARIVTLETLVTRCLRRGNREIATGPDPGIEPGEAKALVSSMYGEMHAVVSETGARYFEVEATITATGAASYALPTAHLSTLGVDLRLDSADRRRRLTRINSQERSLLQGLTGEADYYALESSNLVLYPRPSSGTYLHRYIPQPAYVTSEDDRVLLPQGFERRVIYGMVSHGMIKEGGASAALERQIQRADAEIGLQLFGQGIEQRARIKPRTPPYPWIPRGPGRFR